MWEGSREAKPEGVVSWAAEMGHLEEGGQMGRGCRGPLLLCRCSHHLSAHDLSNPRKLLNGDILWMEIGQLSL